MLVGHLADVLEVGKFPIAQDGRPNHLAYRATIIGMGDTEPCHRRAQVQLLITGWRHRLHSLVVLDPVSNPLVVECLRRFIHDELQAHLLAPVASNDLDKAGSTTALLPKALAMLTHIATSGDTLLFANNLPRGDGAQDQSTLSFGPKDVLLFSPHLLFGILAHHRVHIFNGNGGDNGTQESIGAAGTQASTTVYGSRPPGTGGAPDSPRTVSPNAPNLALGTAADGAVAPSKEGEHPSQTGGSSLFQRSEDKMISTFPWVRLPMALKPLGRREFIPSGCGLRNLLPPSLGSQPSIPT